MLDVEEIHRLKAVYLGHATVDGTGNAHSTAVRSYIFYCVHGLGVNPIQPVNASVEVRQLYETVIEDWSIWAVKYSPSGRRLSADSQIKYVSTLRGWYHRVYRATLGVGPDNGRLRDVLKGMKRVVPQPPPRERLGVTPQGLAAGMEARHPVEAGPEARMWRSATSFGLAGLARGCELALSGGETFDPREHLTPEDVTFFYRGGVRHARVRMRKRKDLRVLRGKHHEVVLGGGGRHVDAVAELWAWMETRAVLGLPRDGPLFCTAEGRAITVDLLRDEVRAMMAAIGLDPSLYGAHSLRIGGATAALAAGIPPALIRIMGRWSSDIYEIYCRMSVEAALGVGAAIGSATVTRPEDGFHEDQLEMLPSEIPFLPPASGSAGAVEDAA